MIDLTKIYVAFSAECVDATLEDGKRVDEIYELAAVKIVDGKISDHFTTFVNIKSKRVMSDIDYYNRVFGVYSEHLVGAPKIDAVMDKFFDFAKDAILLPFDTLTSKAIDSYLKDSGRNMQNDFFRATLLFDKYEDVSHKIFYCFDDQFADIKKSLGLEYIRDDCLGKAIVLAKLFLYVAKAVQDDDEKDVIKLDTITYRSALQYK